MSELKERMLGQTMNSYGCDTKIYMKAQAMARHSREIQTKLNRPAGQRGSKMTHPEFAQEVMTEWNLGPSDFCQACYCQWYHYTIQVDGKTKIIGEYTLRNLKPVFILTKKNGTEKVWEAK